MAQAKSERNADANPFQQIGVCRIKPNPRHWLERDHRSSDLLRIHSTTGGKSFSDVFVQKQLLSSHRAGEVIDSRPKGVARCDREAVFTATNAIRRKLVQCVFAGADGAAGVADDG